MPPLATKTARPRSSKVSPLVTATESMQALAIELERSKGVQSSHEKVCEERYQAINQTMTGMSTDIAGVDGKVEVLDSKLDDLAKKLNDIATANATAIGVASALADARKPNPWLLAIAPVIAGILFGGIVSWAARDHIQGGLGTADRTTTTISTTVPVAK